MLVVVLVLLAAAAGALGLVLLRKATEAEPPSPSFSLALLWLLIRRRPAWAAGIGMLLAGFALQVAALANGPVSLVQLAVILELPFALVLSRFVLGGRLQAREWTAIASMSAGVTVLLLALSPTGGHPTAPTLVVWLVGLALTAGTIGLAVLCARWTDPVAGTALAGVAAGMAGGLSAVLVKAMSPAIDRGLVAVVATWQTWVLVGVGVAAFFLLQNALQSGRLVASQPGITLANPAVATVWGIGLFGEQVRTGWWLVGAALGAALLTAGAVVLSRSPLLAGHREAPDEVPAPSA